MCTSDARASPNHQLTPLLLFLLALLLPLTLPVPRHLHRHLHRHVPHPHPHPHPHAASENQWRNFSMSALSRCSPQPINRTTMRNLKFFRFFSVKDCSCLPPCAHAHSCRNLADSLKRVSFLCGEGGMLGGGEGIDGRTRCLSARSWVGRRGRLGCCARSTTGARANTLPVPTANTATKPDAPSR